MYYKKYKTVAILLLITSTIAVEAAIIINEGSIEQLSFNSQNINESSISVDYWQFAVNETGKVSIDILSWERNPDNWKWNDVNGDGEDSFIDSFIYIFKGDPALDNFYASNDDASLPPGHQDGSIRGNDSFISQVFEAGTYTIAISSCGYPPFFTVEEAVNGVNQKAVIPYASGRGDMGDYQITITGNVSVIPEPATLCMLFGGIAIQRLSKRKIKRG